ncbi:hypothetical protein TZ53_25325 (plasmid) [Sphingobium sp. YBL2]|nr:hypothetical protein TZ53_25325 [Sphingobium sp. YBL2]
MNMIIGRIPALRRQITPTLEHHHFIQRFTRFNIQSFGMHPELRSLGQYKLIPTCLKLCPVIAIDIVSKTALGRPAAWNSA